MLDTAQRLLYDPEAAPAQQHRTCWCNRAITDQGGQAGIWRKAGGGGVRLTGVATCGNVWTCPVCSVRVAEARREELQAALVAWTRFEGPPRPGEAVQGGHAYLLTLTFPHGRNDGLADLLARQAKALQRFKNSATYKRTWKKYGRRGSVRSLEFTWGTENGWHPHTHDVVFAAAGLLEDQTAIDELRRAWIAALIKSGLGSNDKLGWMLEHALDICGGSETADYVTKFGRDAKWGITSEVTRHHAKIGMRAIAGIEHVTPMQILGWAQCGDTEAQQLFRTFAAAVEGKRMLYWSPGLKAYFGVDDRDDQDIAGDDTPQLEEVQVASINVNDLQLIYSRAALGELIEVVNQADADWQGCVDDFLESLRLRPKRRPGTVSYRDPFVRGVRTIAHQVSLAS